MTGFMHIDDLIDATNLYINSDKHDRAQLSIPKEWAQGRTAYGGLTGALVYSAIRQKVGNDRVLRSFTCNFVGPVVTETDFDIAVEVLREGKT